MSRAAVELLIKSRPLWDAPDPARSPVIVRTQYTVLARRNALWTTLLSAGDDVLAARATMVAANRTGVFDRIVIAEGRSVNNAPPQNWNTIECAVPHTVVVAERQLAALFEKLKAQTANGDKQAYPGLLTFAALLGLLNGSPAMLGIVFAMAMIDTSYLANRRPLLLAKRRFLDAYRHWVYAVLCGIYLLPLLLGL